MRKRMTHGLAAVFLVVGLGAAQGPISSESGHTRKAVASAVPNPAVVKVVAKKHSVRPYEVGTASWYGSFFEGKPTASGEPYNMYDLTAAHPTLPLGTLVRVTNLRNGRAVVVRVNDRGPVVPGRIIDLSYGAAKTLRFKNRGLQRVRLDIVPPQQMIAQLHEPALAY